MKMKSIYLIFLLFFTFCVENKTSEDLRNELFIEECSNQFDYLTIKNYNISKNISKKASLFSKDKYDGYIISGIIKNNASVTFFYNINYIVEFYDSENKIIKKIEIIEDEIVNSNSSRIFSLKVYPPKNMNTFNILFKNAYCNINQINKN